MPWIQNKINRRRTEYRLNTETKGFNNESLNTYLLSVSHGQGNYFITQTFIISLGTWHTVRYVMVNKCCWLTKLRLPGDLNGQKNSVISAITIIIVTITTTTIIIFTTGNCRMLFFKMKWPWARIVQEQEWKFWAGQESREEKWKWDYHSRGPGWKSSRYWGAATWIAVYFWLYWSYSC